MDELEALREKLARVRERAAALSRVNGECAEYMAQQIDEITSLQAENARLRKLGEGLAEALGAIFNKLDRDEPGNAPNHGHQMPGIWDDDSSNGPRAGKPCDWCSQWRTFHAALAAWEAGR